MGNFQFIFDLLEKYGLGVTLAMIIVFLFYFVLKNLIKSFNNVIERQNSLLDNHIDHLAQSVNKQESTLAETNKSFEVGVQKICDSINSQTDLIKVWMQPNKK